MKLKISNPTKQQEKIITSKSENIENGLKPITGRTVVQAKGKDDSSWLGVILLEEHLKQRRVQRCSHFTL